MASLNSQLYWTSVPNLDASNPTVIFLHAAWMSSSMFEETIAYLSPILPNTNLLRIDCNGHVKTVAGRKTFNLWDQASDIAALMVRVVDLLKTNYLYKPSELR